MPLAVRSATDTGIVAAAPLALMPPGEYVLTVSHGSDPGGHASLAVFAPELPGLDRDLIRVWYNGYDADKYRAPDRAVHLIGVEISAAERDVAAFDVESA